MVRASAWLRQVIRHGQRRSSVVNIRVPNPQQAEIEFDGGQKFQMSAEYLRVYSPAADSKRRAKVVSGRRHVGIMSIEPIGNYAIRITFDDLHNTGIYTWDYLSHLAENKFSLMRQYIKSLKELGLSRDPRQT